MDLYYNDDLSLAEIAEQMGITRQAVRDCIKKTEAELSFYEEKLGLRRRLTEAERHAERALDLARRSADILPAETCDALVRELEALSAAVSVE